ncbi:GerMN domain-containing protein [Peptostreptococcus equinus]|uniref:GerMN domain-containing protein n=1 Tax=Peptostreptococcus equinus TaxID=3003601 RepID=A0ABY7JT65_9FIRM|nr:GerMN domain-containing protein [Peptostreptococcus sp. CBA3647]WAW14902.1 GerMN domain-containing protein [Peptostreptococcus sp. CBA3647]
MINRKLFKVLLYVGILSISTMGLSACTSSKESSSKNEQTQNQESTNKDSKKDEEKSSSDIDTSSATKKEDNAYKENKEDTKSISKKTSIIYYTIDKNAENLIEKRMSVDEVSVGNITRAMIKEGVLQKGTDVNKAKVKDIDGIRTLVVDMNSKFINPNQGSGTESLMLRAFANSMIKSFHVKQVKLTVDGEPYSGGHIILNDNQFLTYK